MSVHIVSIKKLGKSYKVSEHFTLGELQCKDGTDTVKYSDETLAMVEKLRSLSGCKSIIVTSGYRTVNYNKKIGGSGKSSHIDGYAMDVSFRSAKCNNKQICCIAQDLGACGIGYISNTAIHIDMKPRKTKYRGDERKDYTNNVGNDFYTYFGIAKGSLPTSSSTIVKEKVDTSKLPTIKRKNSAKYVQYVRQMQQKLVDNNIKGKNGNVLVVDGKWGDNTEFAIRKFQKLYGLTVDGICGKKTWKKLYNANN